MLKAINYAFMILILLVAAGMPVIILASLLAIADIELRHDFWLSALLSLTIIPLWILISDALEIFIAFLTKNSRVTAILSILLSFLLLSAVYYLILVQSWLVSFCAASIIFCLIMAIKPYIESKYDAFQSHTL